ncbi:hypothetical protein NKH48_03420 [Mesorhizobium sp. M1233]|uniref:hypothetical protein n=1 Tax=Mesorhizobium sp. M1233 TaxID=2957072 RepID=UPI003334E54E
MEFAPQAEPGALTMRNHTAPIAAMHRRLEGRDTATMSVRVLGCVTSPFGVQYLISHKAKTYVVNRHLLAALRDGGTPESLDLISVEDDAEDPEYPADDRASSAADRRYQAAREEL